MTEQEAKTKWCPFTRASDLDGNRGLISGHEHPQTMCIGSACMAWRGEGGPVERFASYRMNVVPDGEGWRCTLPDTARAGFTIKSMWERDMPAQGHCGLAGKP